MTVMKCKHTGVQQSTNECVHCGRVNYDPYHDLTECEFCLKNPNKPDAPFNYDDEDVLYRLKSGVDVERMMNYDSNKFLSTKRHLTDIRRAIFRSDGLIGGNRNRETLPTTVVDLYNDTDDCPVDTSFNLEVPVAVFHECFEPAIPGLLEMEEPSDEGTFCGISSEVYPQWHGRFISLPQKADADHLRSKYSSRNRIPNRPERSGEDDEKPDRGFQETVIQIHGEDHPVIREGSFADPGGAVVRYYFAWVRNTHGHLMVFRPEREEIVVIDEKFSFEALRGAEGHRNAIKYWDAHCDEQAKKRTTHDDHVAAHMTMSTFDEVLKEAYYPEPPKMPNPIDTLQNPIWTDWGPTISGHLRNKEVNVHHVQCRYSNIDGSLCMMDSPVGMPFIIPMGVTDVEYRAMVTAS